MRKSDILHYIATVMNDEQSRFSALKQEINATGVTKVQAGKDSVEVLELIHNTRRELLEDLYKKIQGM